MPLTSIVQTNLNSGEISPRALGRSDLKRYLGGAAIIENMIVQKLGDLTRRSGTRFAASTKNPADLAILYPFRSSVVANYVVELGDLYARFYVDRGQLLDPASAPVEITTPWATSELRALKFMQSADVLYVFHPDHETREIRRTSSTTFEIRRLGAIDGPYQSQNTKGTWFVASAATGTVTINSFNAATGTTPSVAGVNDGLGFMPGDVGRMIRWVESAGSAVTWLRIATVALTVAITSNDDANPLEITLGSDPYVTGDFLHITGTSGTTGLNDKTYLITRTGVGTYTLDGIDGTSIGAGTGGTARRATVITATVEGPDIGAGELTRKTWALGSWSDTSGWPRCGVFHQGRLWAAGTATQPQSVWSSVTGIFDTFSPSELDLTVLADSAITRTLDTDRVLNIYQMESHAKGLLMLTDGGEVLGSTSGGTFDPLTPDNFGVLIQSTHGIKSTVRAQKAGNAILLPQASGRKIREFLFRFEDDQFIANDLTELAEHIGGDGFVDAAYQEEPDQTLWLVREDGQLLGLTYDPTQRVFAWHRHIIGGTFKGGDAVVESVAVIRDSPADLAWIIVKRTIDGSTARHVEYIGDRFDTTDSAEEAFFVDSGIPQSDFFLETITSITKGNPTTFTTTRLGIFGFPTPSDIALRDIQSTGDLAGVLNDNTFVYTNVSDIAGIHTFTLAVDTSSTSGDYLSGGTARKEFTVVSGLDHLEGETVRVAGDGVAQVDQVVSSGAITLATAASIIYIGLQMNSRFVSLPLVPLAQGFDVRTKQIRAVRSWLMLHRSQGGTMGQFGEAQFPIEYDDTDLFTGIKEIEVEGTFDERFQLEVIADSISPLTILQIGTEVDVGGS